MTVLDPLDEEALVRVLLEPKNSIVRQYKELLHLDNAELVFTDAALHAIARKTVERKSGARGLRSVVEELLIPIMYDIPSDATITKVTIDADTVEGGQPHIEHGAMRPRYKKFDGTAIKNDLHRSRCGPVHFCSQKILYRKHLIFSVQSGYYIFSTQRG